MGMINWCDSKITQLKRNNITFINGIPQVSSNMRYEKIPKYIETYQYRNEIPKSITKESIICFYSNDNVLSNRLKTIEQDSKIFKQYGGIVGMDISPSINMLKPRQMHSILINSIYDFLMAIRGIKVAINARVGDLSTIHLIDNYPKNKCLVFGNLGCKRKFRAYSRFLFEKWIEKEKPKNICVYGTLTKKDLDYMQKLNRYLVINLYQGHNNSKDKNKKSAFIISGNKYTSNNPREGHVLALILSKKIKKFNGFACS